MKLNGNFKKEEIVDINDIAEKEREDLFSGKTLKVASVEKKKKLLAVKYLGLFLIFSLKFLIK